MKLSEWLQSSPFQSYVYAYPHKTAYRRLEPALDLSEVWADERRDGLFLYIHIPFCGMRCGFCNLFTQAKPADHLVDLYLDALEQEANCVRAALPDARFARMAIGGGTPTYLSVPQLERLLVMIERFTGSHPRSMPSGIEVSPETLTAEHAGWIASSGFQRVSMGIQSFIETETMESGRPQKVIDVENALNRLRDHAIPIRNIDLIYGLPRQSVATWTYSVGRALEWEPEEIYLYPLYVRPLTAMGQSRKEWDDIRVACYRAGRDMLADAGYEQVSLRMFRRTRSPNRDGTVYCCQDDGMVGLGCGARSYTRSLHYSGEYAVRAKGIREILSAYITRGDAERGQARHGFRLSPNEQRRRFVLQSLLQFDAGLDVRHYEQRFSSDPFNDLPELRELQSSQLATFEQGRLRLTAEGLEYSDAIGPYFYSETVRGLMAEYELR